VYDEFPGMAFFEVQYTNIGKSDLSVDGWTNHSYALTAPPGTAEPVYGELLVYPQFLGDSRSC
jgi:alpha-galactosidase